MPNAQHRIRRQVLVTVVVMTVFSSLLAPVASAVPPGERAGSDGLPVADAGRFVDIAPARALDTRRSVCVPSRTGRQVDIAGRFGVERDATAVVLNVTVPRLSFGGYVTVYDGTTNPGVSNLNFRPGSQIANTVTTALADDGTVTVYAEGGGCTQVIVDVTGYYTGGDEIVDGGLTTVPRKRLLDTRKERRDVCDPDGLVLAIDEPGADSVVLNVTVVGATSGGYMTVYPYGDVKPWTSNLNYAANQTIANQVTVGLGDGNRIRIAASAGCPHVVVDIAAYYSSGRAEIGGYVRIAPKRFLDTRRDGAWSCPTPLGPSRSTLTIAGVNGVPETASGAVLNVTVVTPRMHGFATVYPLDSSRPMTSSLNYRTNQTIPNQVVTGLGAGGAVGMFADRGCPDMVVDVVGYFIGELPPAPVVVEVASTTADVTPGAVFSSTLTASGGSGGYTWAVTGDTNLPGWLSLAGDTGVLSGTAATGDVGRATFDVVATDSDGNESDPATVTITVLDPVEADDASVVLTVGEVLDVALVASGGDGSYTWEVADGSTLPEWVDLDGGVLTGTATVTGSYVFGLVATDGNGGSASSSIEIEVVDELAVTSRTVTATVGDELDVELAASGGHVGDGYTWSADPATLPEGWSVVDGRITGTVTDAATAQVVVTAQDASGATASGTVTVTISLLVTTTEFHEPVGGINEQFMHNLSAEGGHGDIGDYRWTIVEGSLPGTIGLSPVGTLAGYMKTPGIVEITVQVEDGDGHTSAPTVITITIGDGRV